MSGPMWAVVAWAALSCFFLWLFGRIEDSPEQRRRILNERRRWHR